MSVPERRRNFAVTTGSSEQHAGLQVADFVAGAVFQWHEKQIDAWYECIKSKIRFYVKRRF